jgi:hypothetical protein
VRRLSAIVGTADVVVRIARGDDDGFLPPARGRRVAGEG